MATSETFTVRAGTFFFGTPYSRVGASVGYIKSLIEFASNGRMRPLLVGSTIAPGTSYGQQRNAIVYAAMEARAEWILMIDDDITFPWDIAMRLAITGAENNAPIIIGAVPVSQTEMNVWRSDDGRVSPARSIMPEGKEVEPADAYGCAVAMIHMSVISDMAAADGWGSWFNCITLETTDPSGARVMTQLEPDLSFALRAKRLGMKAIARFGLGLTHSKPVELRYEV